jgi:hypothetical protein
VFAAVESVASSILHKRVAVRTAFVDIIKNVSRKRLALGVKRNIGDKERALAWQDATVRVSSHISRTRLSWYSSGSRNDDAGGSGTGDNEDSNSSIGGASKIDNLEARVEASEAKVDNSEEAWVAVGHGNLNGKRRRPWLDVYNSLTMERAEFLLAQHIDRASLIIFPISYAVYTASVFAH